MRSGVSGAALAMEATMRTEDERMREGMILIFPGQIKLIKREENEGGFCLLVLLVSGAIRCTAICVPLLGKKEAG